MATGITVRKGARGKSYRAEVWDNAAGRSLTKTFPTEAAAKAWRRDTMVKVANGTLRAAEPTTVREAWEQWIVMARAGEIRARGGQEYKPAVLHSYESIFQYRLLKAFGHVKVRDLRRIAIQRYVRKLTAEGLAAQTIRNIATALRVLLRWCVSEELLAVNPCGDLELPSGGSVRDRIAGPSEALDLVQALVSAEDRAIMATAFFGGLRRGELMGLRWDCVDLMGVSDWALRDPDGTTRASIRIHPERGNYDTRTHQFVSPKSRKGARTLGIPALLVPFLAKLNGTEGLLFPRPSGAPFSSQALAERCRETWAAAGLEKIGLHEARHTYASIMIAANVNIGTVSEWMGHSSVTITLDRYRHLLPGSAKEALGLLEAYLERELAA